MELTQPHSHKQTVKATQEADLWYANFLDPIRLNIEDDLNIEDKLYLILGRPINQLLVSIYIQLDEIWRTT